MGKLVGILSPASLFEEIDSKKDVYRFGNNYSKRIYECGGIPLGILPNDGSVSEKVLEKFDSFLICGGTKTWPAHLQVVQYAIMSGKPILGICLGMQTIHRCFKMMDYMEENGYQSDLYSLFAVKRDEDWLRLEDVEGHRKVLIRGREDECKHVVKFVNGSHIQRLLGTDTAYCSTFHNYRIHHPSEKLIISGRAEDGTIEVIEYEDRVLGVQFDTLFTDDLYFEISRHAIDLAERLKEILLNKGYKLYIDSPTNQQFVIIEDERLEKLKETVAVSFWEKYDETHTVIRLATGWSTSEGDLKKLESVL